MRTLLIVVAAAVVTAQAQAPNLAGTWRLDETKSNVVATAGIIGLISAGAPKTLHITQPSNGTVVIESQVNEAHVRIYKPGRETSTPAGQGGAVSMASRWEGTSLVSDGALKAPNGDTTAIREVVSLSADGKVLTMTVSTSATLPAGAAATADRVTSTLIYSKITDVGPCETWPTPCKKFP
jgi:hypothetical protein